MFGAPGLLQPKEVLADPAVGDDVDAHRRQVHVAADVVAVVVAVEQVTYRLRGDAAQGGEDVGQVLRILVVHENHAFGCYPCGHVARLVNQPVVGTARPAAARATGHERAANHVQTVLHPLDAGRPGGQHLDVLAERQSRILHPRVRGQQGEHDQRGGNECQAHRRPI